MHFKKEKYFGEVWFFDKENQKQFCVLEIIDNNVFLNTNLSIPILTGKVDVIYGKFNDLGNLTFVNCIIKTQQSGIVEYNKYCPDFVFSSLHHSIQPKGLRLKTIEIENNTINDLIRTLHQMNPVLNKVEIESFKTHEVEINEDITLLFYKNYGIETSKLSANIVNHGIIKFNFKKEITLLESIEVYKKFQKFCIIYFSGIERYKSFQSVCLNCNEKYNILFNDNLEYQHGNSLFNSDFLKDKDVFSTVISNWFNNEDLAYCFDIIIENYLSKKVSNARRFTNSISSFEAFYKLFSKGNHTQLNKRIVEYELAFTSIDSSINDIVDFGAKMIRIRDFYVHGNREQKVIHDNNDLLHYSLLIDFVVIKELSFLLGFSEAYLDRIKNKSATIFDYQLPMSKVYRNNHLID